MSRLSGSNGVAPRSFWLIAKGETRRMDALRIILATDEEALPVFRFEDEARMFLRLGALDDDWHLRETGAGELISILYCLCMDVEKVVLDPLPGPSTGLNDFLSIGRGAFLEFAAEQGCGGRGAVPAPTAVADRAVFVMPDYPDAKTRRGRRSSQDEPNVRPYKAAARMVTLNSNA